MFYLIMRRFNYEIYGAKAQGLNGAMAGLLMLCEKSNYKNGNAIKKPLFLYAVMP